MLFAWLFLDRPYPNARIRWIFHLAFWLLVATFTFSQLQMSAGKTVPLASLLSLLAVILLTLLVSYYGLSIGAITALQKQRYLLAFIVLVLSYVVTTALYYYGLPYLSYPSWISLRFYNTYRSGNFWNALISYSVFIFNWSFSFSTLLLPLLAKGFKLHYLLRYEQQRLLQQKAELEISSLKAQIQPHFILNTLHNLYALALERDNDLATQILNVSQLIDYQSQPDRDTPLPLSREIAFISRYVALQRLRFKPDFPLHFNVTSIQEELEIYPFLLITCIENAFKHGISPRGEPSWITIDLAIQASGELKLRIENSAFTPTHPPGRGLALTQQRLHLLYPQRHHLSYQQNGSVFTTQLTLLLR